MALGFSSEEHIQAKKDHAERAARVAQAQASVRGVGKMPDEATGEMGGDPAARGVPELSAGGRPKARKAAEPRSFSSRQQAPAGSGPRCKQASSGGSDPMNIEREAVADFVVGHGGAHALAEPIVAAGYANKVYKGVRVRAATANTIVIYVRPTGVTTSSGKSAQIAFFFWLK